MIYLILLPVYIAFHVFFFLEVYKWIDAIASAIKEDHNKRTLLRVFKIILTVLYSICGLSLLLAWAIPDSWAIESHVWNVIRRIIKMIGNYHEGVFIYLLMGFAIAELMRLFIRLWYRIRREEHKLVPLRHAIIGLSCFIFIVVVTVFGIVKARRLETTNYSVTVNKSAGQLSELRIALVSDLHLGYNIGSAEMKNMVKKINAANPDVVLIAGDFFDNEYIALDNPEGLVEIFNSIETKYGMYACYGNHDIEETILGGFTFGGKKNKESSDAMDKFVADAGITLLRDDYALIADEVYVYGRPDYSRPGKNVVERRSPDDIVACLDSSKPIIVLDHQPRELDELAKAGVDMDLCGHTHDGQIFPLNLTSKYLTWENSCGYLKKENMHNIVTSGVGVFGPNMRVGTKAEICIIDVRFEE